MLSSKYLPFFALLLPVILLAVPSFQTGDDNGKGKGKEKQSPRNSASMGQHSKPKLGQEEKQRQKGILIGAKAIGRGGEETAQSAAKDGTTEAEEADEMGKNALQMLIEAAERLNDDTADPQMVADSPGKKRKMGGTAKKVPTQKRGRKTAAANAREERAQMPSSSSAQQQSQSIDGTAWSSAAEAANAAVDQLIGPASVDGNVNAAADQLIGPASVDGNAKAAADQMIGPASVDDNANAEPMATPNDDQSAAAEEQDDDGTEFLLFDNYDLGDNDLAKLFGHPMPPNAVEEAEERPTDRQTSIQELADKFHQKTSLLTEQRGDKAEGSSSRSPRSKAELNASNPKNARTQKIEEALQKANKELSRYKKAGAHPALEESAQFDDRRPIHVQLDESISEWLLNENEEAAKAYEAGDEREEGPTRAKSPLIGSRSAAPYANELSKMRMIPSPTVKMQRGNNPNSRFGPQTLQFVSRLRTTGQPSPAQSPSENVGTFATGGISPLAISPTMTRSLLMLRRQHSPHNSMPNSPSFMASSSAARTPTTRAVSGGGGEAMLIDSPSSASSAQPSPSSAIASLHLGASTPPSSSPLSLSAERATESQRQSAEQIEEVAVQAIASSIRALGKANHQVRFGYTVSGTGPCLYALDVDVKSIVKLINDRKSESAFKAENMTSKMRAIKNESINELLAQIEGEQAQFRDQIATNNQKRRELNFLFFFIRLYRKLGAHLKWPSMEMGLKKIREDLLACVGILGAEIWQEFVKLCSTNKNRKALQWAEKLGRFDDAIELTNFGIYLLFSSRAIQSVGLGSRPTAREEFVDRIGRQFIEQQISDNYLTESADHAAWKTLEPLGLGSISYEKLKAIWDPLVAQVRQCNASMAHVKNVPTKAIAMAGLMRRIRDELNRTEFGEITVPQLTVERANGLAIVDKCLAILSAKIEAFNGEVRRELWEVDKTCRALTEGDGRTNDDDEKMKQ